jgi:Mrp family chromosome partitioning ATPase
MKDTSFEQQLEDMQIKDNMNLIKHKIMIMSNKGGVGKSTVSSNIAEELSEQGYQVGLLDIDIHGPSQAKIFNLSNKKLMINENEKIIPFQPKKNLKIVSIAGMLENENQPIIWRGPLKINVIKQFITNVLWGKLDYLIIDAPPGTGDEPLTIAQIIPNLTGMIIVTTPQELALLDSRKAIAFAEKLKVKILGAIENMSYLICPQCNQKIDLFKKHNEKNIFEEMNIDILGTLPFEPKLLKSMDEGQSFMKENKETTLGQTIQSIVTKIKIIVGETSD